jgi:hypothetical protein
VALRRALGDDQLRRDLTVGHSLGDQSGNLELSLAQRGLVPLGRLPLTGPVRPSEPQLDGRGSIETPSLLQESLEPLASQLQDS